MLENIHLAECMSNIYSDGINRLEIDQAVDLPEIQWEPVKDPDFFQTIDLPLEDFLYGGQYDVKVTRKIREIGKKSTRDQDRHVSSYS